MNLMLLSASRLHRLKLWIMSPSAGALILTFIAGYTLGQAIMSRKIQNAPLKFTEDTRPLIPVVEINGIYDGELDGAIKGEARVFLGENQIIPDPGGAFKVRADDLFINYIRVRVPGGMNYVASRRGRYYYPVGSSAGERITPGNREYFKTADEARRAGYVSN